MDKRILYILIVFLICPLSATHADNYFLSPSGSDGSSGGSTDQAWASIQYAAPRLNAGDTLFVMGGTYTNQYCHDLSGNIHGTPGNPIVFKAYGDEVAVFRTTDHPGDSYYHNYFMLRGGPDHIVIDGYSYLEPEKPLYWKLESNERAEDLIEIHGTSSNFAEHITIRGMSLDGDNGGIHDARMRMGMKLYYVRYALVADNYINYVNHPTGNISPGDNTDTSQGTGDGIFLVSCEAMIISGNTLKNCNHCAIDLGGLSSDYVTKTKYITIKDNIIESRWGGGIYLTCSAEYCLVDNNIITNCGETTTFNKPGIQVSGPYNTIRRNVIYNPANNGIDMEAQVFWGWQYIVDGCQVYNNTVFGSGHGYSIKMMVNNDDGGNASVCSAENIIVKNNIFYKSDGDVSGSYEPEIFAVLYKASDDHNWIEPNNSTTEPASTHWGDNVFSNNCVRRNDAGPDHGGLILYTKDRSYGGYWFSYSLTSLEAQDPVAWHDNTGINPLIVSEEPESYGLLDGWWYLLPSSRLINAGTWIDDTIGADVKLLHPGYGWDNLSYRGGAPDIGAHESPNEDRAPMSSPDASIRPGTEF